jgi:predicted nuclease of predicted toxin-antitoxin system
MKFLVEVNASGSLVDELIRLGHDVAAVAEKDPRMRDADILRWAVSEQQMIVTTDHDFEAMIWRQGKAHCGVLRLENPPRAERGILLDDVLRHHSQDLASGVILIVQSGKIRIRRPFHGRAGVEE